MNENVYLGIDLGIGSCGWALTTDTAQIALGSRIFDVPETSKERTPTNQLRRIARGLRRVTSRRRRRMNDVRALLHRHGLLETPSKHALEGTGKINPWQIRAEGLDRLLSRRELALALGHIAKHRGFKSNSKRDRSSNAADESSKMLAAAAKLQEKEQKWRSVGETFWKDIDLHQRQRNRDGDYSRTILRADLEREVRLLLQSQRRLGNSLATDDLEDEFLKTAFFQRPLADSEDKVGFCPFEAGERRTARYAPSFERFRLLARLTSLRISGRSLRPEELSAATKDFGHQQGLTYSRLRKLLGLTQDERFENVPPDEEGRHDVVARSGKAMPGSATLFKILGEAGWHSLSKTPDKLDRIAEVLTFREDADRIRLGLEEIGLNTLVLNALIQGVEKGAFATFKGAGHISAKACREITPHMAQGLVYSAACEKAGYAHAKQAEINLDNIANPIARKALGEALKQINAIIRTYGKPSHIHVELARDVGRSKEERNDIRVGMDKREREKEKLRQQYRGTVGGEPNAEDLLRFELWKEQGGRSFYTDKEILPRMIASSCNEVQVDHILPWSRSGDDSFINKTLCFTEENQQKKGNTPYEWFQAKGLNWDAFVARVEGCKTMKGRKKRNYLLKDASVLEGKFRSRNLNDTRYACRLLLNVLQQRYEDIEVAALPGALTDRLRRAWGLQGLKKNENGERIEDDRHHALDALIVALTSKTRLDKLTLLFQEAERQGWPTDWHRTKHLVQQLRKIGVLPKEISSLEPPWPGFREDTIKLLAGVIVSRAERRRARGEAHAATIRQVSERDGQQIVYERKPVETLTETDLLRIKDAERNHRTIAILKTWIAEGKPKDKLPISPQGHVMRKIRLITNKKVDVEVRGGAADRGEMARVDVFRKENKKGKWEYYMVPIYPHEVATLDAPPNCYIIANKSEKDWPPLDQEHEFLWSLYPMSWIEVVKPTGEILCGYFRGTDRSTGAIALSEHHSKSALVRGIGVKTLASFRKFAIDRLGNLSEIERETRTWHGKVCI